MSSMNNIIIAGVVGLVVGGAGVALTQGGGSDASSGASPAAAPAAAPASENMLEVVRARGAIHCGVSTGLAGFSLADSSGRWTGIDVDMCRAVAAAALGDAEKVKFVPLNASQRFTALQSGEVDLLVRNTTWTATRDTQLGLVFAGVNFYDGQGFMVPKKLGVKSVFDLNNAAVCLQTGTTTEKNVADFFKAQGMTYKPVLFADQPESVQAYDSGRCQVYTTDASGLAAIRANDVNNPDAHVILPELISKEPLGPVVRRGDDQWFALVKWVHIAMVNAEERGVSSANVDRMRSSDDPQIQRLLGVGGNDYGKAMGVDADWAYRVIKQVGNYGEVYEANVGPNTPIGLPRGNNALWTEGGLQYGPPIR